MAQDTQRKTPLYNEHAASGARIVDFAGWAMPVSYRGILDEVRAVRSQAGIFDVSHMGSIMVSGPGAAAMLDYLVPSDISGLAVSQARYTMFCNNQGGVLDDLIIYRLDNEQFLVIVNASRREDDLEHIFMHMEQGIHVVDETEIRSIIAVQGPSAEPVLKHLSDTPLTELKHFRITAAKIAGQDSLIARTGYTGEDGFEIMSSAVSAPVIWRTLLEEGKDLGLLPCGLGARDVLRLEAGLPLYGHELSEETNPYEVGFGWIVKLDKGDFIGRKALKKIREQALRRMLLGLVIEGKQIPREKYSVFEADRRVGTVTSGTYSPTLEKPIAMAMLDTGAGEQVEVEVRSLRIPARVVKLPFYRRK